MENELENELLMLIGEAKIMLAEHNPDKETLDAMYMRMALCVEDMGVSGRKAMIAKYPECRAFFRDLNRFKRENTH